MESTATASNKIELIKIAIQQLIESKQASVAETQFIENDEDTHILAKLLSQLESLKGDAVVEQPEPSTQPKAPSGTTREAEKKTKDENETSGAEDHVVKELKKLEKQNKITHWLLSALIFLTVTWQLSEVSLLLKFKDGLSHPFRSLGSMVTEMLKGPSSNGLKADKQSSSTTKQNATEAPLKLPHMDLSGFIMNDEEE